MAFDMSDYVDVPARIAILKEKHPQASLRPLNPEKPFWIETIGDQTFVVFAAACFRTPDDPCPGVGIAWEPVPGRTQFTKDSELQNAETSAWGRAIIAALVADAKAGIASAEDVRNRESAPATPSPARRAETSTPSQPAAPDADDPWQDVIGNPDGWYDNRSGKKNPKAPDFKAKKNNSPWNTAGKNADDSPGPMALWLSNAPEGFMELLIARDLGTDPGDVQIEDKPITGRGRTAAEAKANLAANSAPPPTDEDWPEGEEPF